MIIVPIEDGNSNINLVRLQRVRNGIYPYCEKHGAMNKVSAFKDGGGYWRCCTTDGLICRAGCIEQSKQ